MSDTEVYRAPKTEWDDVLAGMAPQQDVRNNLKAARTTDPNAHAHALEVASRNGIAIPAAQSAIRGGLDAQAADGEWDKLFAANPEFTAWMRDPSNATLAQDDREALDAHLKAAAQYRESNGSLGQDLLSAYALGGGAVVRSAMWLGRSIGAVDEEQTDRFLDFAAQQDALFLERFRPAVKEYRQRLAQTSADPRERIPALFSSLPGFLSQSVQSGTEFLPALMLGGVGGAALRGAIGVGGGAAAGTLSAAEAAAANVAIGRIGGAIGMGLGAKLVTQGAFMDEKLAESKYDMSDPAQRRAAARDPALMSEAWAKAQTYGNVQGVMSALGGVLAGHRVAGAAGFFKKAIGAAKELGEQTMLEGATEATSRVAAEPKSVYTNGYWSNVIDEMAFSLGESAGTITMGTVLRAAGTSGHPAQPQAEQAIQEVGRIIGSLSDSQALAEVKETFDASKTAQRAPSRASEIMRLAGLPETISVSKEAWNRAAAKQGKSPADFAAEITPDGARLYHETPAAGALVLPTRAAVEKIDGATFQSLIPDIEARPGNLTPTQAAGALEQMEAEVDAANEAAQTLFQEGRDIDEELGKLDKEAQAPTGEAAPPPVRIDMAKRRSQIEQVLVQQRTQLASERTKAGDPALQKYIQDSIDRMEAQLAETEEEVVAKAVAYQAFLAEQRRAGKELTERRSAERVASMLAQAVASGAREQTTAERIQLLRDNIKEAEAFLSDPALAEIAQAEIAQAQADIAALEQGGEVSESAAAPVAPAAATAKPSARRQQLLSRKAEIMAQIAKGVSPASQVQAFQADLEAKLIGAGRKKAESRLHARLWATGMATIAERFGISFDSMAARFRLDARKGIEGETDADRLKQGERGALTIKKIGSGRLYVLSFYETANPTTALHEFTHGFVDIMGVLAADEAAPQQMRDDYATMLAEVGAKPGDVLTVQQLETLAKKGEVYFATGEAPTPALRRMFQTMRRWMLKVYQSVQAMGVTVSPQLSAVFDRMLATDREIAAAQYETGASQSFDADTLAKMEPDAQAAYWAAFHAAGDAAREHVQKALLKEIGKEATDAFEAAVADAKPKIAKTIADLPATQTLAKIQTGTLAKIDRDAAKARFSPQVVADMEKAGVLGSGGLPPDAAASLYGFPSQDAMAQTFAALSDQEALIDAAARAQVASESGRFLTPAQVREQSRQAARDEAHADRLATELASLQALAGAAEEGQRLAFTAIPSIQAMRLYAAGKIAALPYSALRPNQYMQAAAREARASKKAMSEGDYIEAAEAKARELVNFELYRLAATAKERMATDSRVIARMDGEKRMARLGKADPSYRDRMADILFHYGFREHGSGHADPRGALETLLTSLAEQGRQPDFGTEVLAGEPRPWQTLTQDQLHRLRLDVEGLWGVAKQDETFLNAQIEGTRSELEAEMAASAGTINPGDREPPRRLGLTMDEKDRRKWGHVFASFSKVTEIVRQLDGGKDGGAWWRVLIRPLNHAANRRREIRTDLTHKRVALNALYTKEERRALETKEAVPGVSEPASHADRLMVLLNKGNEGNQQRLDATIPREQQDALIQGRVTKKDIEWVRGIVGLYESLRDPWFDMHEAATGVRPEAVESKPFTVTTTDGEVVTLPGWYFPIEYTGLRASELTDAQKATELRRAALGRSMTRHDHLEARAERVDRTLNLDLDVIDRTLDQIVLDLTHRNALIDANMMMGREGVQQAIVGALGEPAYREIQGLLKDIAVDDSRFSERSDWFFRRLRRGVSAAILGYKVTTAAVNTTGIVQSIHRVGGNDGAENGAYWMGQALTKLSTPKAVAAVIEEINAKNSFMRNRMENLTREQVENAKLSKGKDVLPEHFTYYLLGRTQALQDYPTFLAAYLKAINGGKEEAVALDIAESVVRESQGTGDIIDLARIQRGSELKKWATIFYHYSSTTLAREQAAWAKLKAKDPGTYARFLADQVLLMAAPAAISAAIYTAMSALRGEDPDDDDYWRRFGEQLSGNYFGLAPLLRNAGSSLAYGRPTGPEARLYEAVAQVAKQTYYATTLDEDFDAVKAMKAANMVSGIWFGYGAEQMNTTLEGLASWLSGEAGPAAVLVGPERR